MPTQRMNVMPPPGPRQPIEVTLHPGKFHTDFGFKITTIEGAYTVATAPLNAKDQSQLVFPDDDGFYGDIPALRITAGASGAKIRLEYHPGVQKRGGPEGSNPHVRY